MACFNRGGRRAAQNLDIYWIDVEGGAATLIVSPSGESMLIDTGWVVGDRDAKRIYAAAQLAGVKKIDDLVISHFHGDHVGGLAALVKLIPVGRFFDHGDVIEKANQQWLDSYHAASAGKRTIVKPGDEIPLKGVKVVVVSSDQRRHRQGHQRRRRAQSALRKRRGESAGEPENQRTIGVLSRYRKFKYLNLIDLDWEKDMELACPVNKLGTVTSIRRAVTARSTARDRRRFSAPSSLKSSS